MARAAIVCLLLLSGCTTRPPLDLATFRGWSHSREDAFTYKIVVGDHGPDMGTPALSYAAFLATQAGCRSFEIIAGPAESGTSVYWGNSYSGGRGILAATIGSYYRIKCHRESPGRKNLWIDARKILEREPLDFLPLVDAGETPNPTPE